MRLLLDAHISAPVVGEALRGAGHDVLALAEHRAFDGLADPDVLGLAADEARVLVTFNARDFVSILRLWAEAGRSHAGCVVVYGIGHGDFGRLLGGLERVLAQRPDPAMWRDACRVLPLP